MMTCVESYCRIREALKDNPSKEVKDAVWILEQFKGIFENIDLAITDPVMMEICRNLPDIHFKTVIPLTEKPVKTIQDEYFKRSGKQLPGFFCIAAYYNTVRFDIQQKVKAAAEKRNSVPDADKEQQKHSCPAKDFGSCTCKDCTEKETCTRGGEQK